MVEPVAHPQQGQRGQAGIPRLETTLLDALFDDFLEKLLVMVPFFHDLFVPVGLKGIVLV
tara:strand:- start:215 stop:394 length:180 start_codon:yes stop_codon:yes gene_type:complete